MLWNGDQESTITAKIRRVEDTCILHSLPNAIGKSAAVVPLTRYSDQGKGTSSISSRLDLMVKSIEQHCAMPKAHLKLNWINLLKCNYCDNIHT